MDLRPSFLTGKLQLRDFDCLPGITCLPQFLPHDFQRITDFVSLSTFLITKTSVFRVIFSEHGTHFVALQVTA